MDGIIKSINKQKEYYFREGCFITELSNSADDPDVSVARARVEPGVTTQWHSLIDTTERYIILEGVGRVEVGESPARSVVEGDVFIIPAQCRQRITNTGKKDLLFLAVCSPRFLIKNYIELDEKANK